MIQQRADTGPFDPGIGAEEIFSVEIIKFLADRIFGEAHAALMTRGRPAVFVVGFVVFINGCHQRRQEVFPETGNGSGNAACDKFRTVFQDPDEFRSQFHQVG